MTSGQLLLSLSGAVMSGTTLSWAIDHVVDGSDPVPRAWRYCADYLAMLQVIHSSGTVDLRQRSWFTDSMSSIEDVRPVFITDDGWLSHSHQGLWRTSIGSLPVRRRICASIRRLVPTMTLPMARGRVPIQAMKREE
jgi:hypothetical protein